MLSSEYACCLSVIIHIVDTQFCIKPSCYWINYGEAHEVNTYVIFTFQSVLTYEVYTLRTPGSHYDQLSIGARPYLWLCLLFLVRFARFVL
jgi:hypothetical protein